MTNIFLILLPIVLLVISLFASIKFFKKSGNCKKAISLQLASLVFICTMCLSVSTIASATSTDVPESSTSVYENTEAANNKSDINKGLAMIAASVAVGIAGIAGGIAVAAGAPAAIAATSENPKSFGKYMVFVALGEGIALFGVVIAIMIILMS